METPNSRAITFDKGVLRHSFFEQYFKPLVMFAGHYITDTDAQEDIVQDTFLSLIESKKRFDSPEHLKAYLYLAVKNRCLKYLRHREVTMRHGKIYSKELEFDAEFQSYAIEEEVFSRLISEINELPDYYRKVYLLALEGKKNQEIADELELTLETVKTYKKEGKNMLRERLKNLGLLQHVFLLLGI